MDNKSITPIKAMEFLRQYSRQGIPCNIKYLSLNESEGTTKGIVEENSVIITAGYRRNQSKKHNVLASFQRTETGEYRQFYFPLLTEMNGISIKP